MSESTNVAKLTWTSVESSTISAVAHEDESLFVQFKGGGIFEYAKVPDAVYNELLAAKSKGAYFNKHIKGIYHEKNALQEGRREHS